MPHFNLRYFMQTMGKERGRDIFLLQIGAMDGKTFDPMHEYITQFRWQGLLVEPVKEHFAALSALYKDHEGMALANVAVGEHDGLATLHRIKNEDVARKRVPHWGLGLASLYKDRNALAFAEVEPLMIEEEVPCLRLSTLLKSYAVPRIDILQIDAEGHDYHILKQLNFNKYHPLVINMEIVNIPKAEQTACKHLLDAQGYLYSKAGYDMLAVSPQFFHQLM